MTSLRNRLTPFAALVLLAGYLVWGVHERVTQGPLEDGERVLGFVPDTTVSGEIPPCISTGMVGKGTTLSQVLDREGVSSEEAQTILVQLASLTNMKNVDPKDEYRLFTDRLGNLRRVEFQDDLTRYCVVERADRGFKSWRVDEPIQKVPVKVEGTVDGSLYASMMADGVSPQLAATFCDVFSCDVDFATETRDGDQFELIIEQTMKDGRAVGGRLLGGRYRNGGKAHEAVYFQGADGKGGFYQPSGESMRRAFLKSPLNYTRISSSFSMARVHPIFKTVRPHMGVDYAAPTGTPVVSLADGVVDYAGWVNGFGNQVRVKHPGNVVTVYSHLSRYGRDIKRGTRVDQNQVVGYVGQTGHATGPHLDFRIELSGRYIDPLRFKSSAGEPLAVKDRPAFDEALRAWRNAMDGVQVAENMRKL